MKPYGLLLLLPSAPAFCAPCLPFDQAQKHIGENQCITGKVVRVQAGSEARTIWIFVMTTVCARSQSLFSHDLKNVGDVRQLAGKVVEIRGEVKEYDDRAEIVLESKKQLTGESAILPPMPRNFDVEQRGHFSAGKFRARKSRSTYRKKGSPTLPAEIPEDVEE